MDKKIIGVTVILLLTCSVDAVKVGVVVQFPEGDLFKKCLSVDEDTNGYDVMEKTGLDITWSAPGPWGHGLCAINDIGCPASNCFCNPDEYWNFYIKKSGEDSWNYSGVGFDGGESCSGHYCAEEGDVLGFAYGGYGTEPLDVSFKDICISGKRRSKQFDVSISPEELFTGDLITIVVEDSSTGEGVKDVEVDVLNGHKVSGETDDEGRISFKLDEPGVYKLRINARGYNPPQRYVDIEVEATAAITSTTTSSSSTTTSTTSSSSTTSTITTTSSTSTSTTSTPITSTTTSSIPTTTILEIPAGRVVGSPAGDSSLILLVVFISVALLGVYLKRRM